jgi:putative ABC transport system ATP-binding protein
MIYINKINKVYKLGATEVEALKSIELAIPDGEFLAIAGASGSGKSTLLSLVGCLERPTGGSIRIGDVETLTLSSAALAGLRAKLMGFVFQTFNLLPVLTAYENVEYPLHLNKVPSPERGRRVVSLLQQVGLERFAHHKPAQLSGGQRQRVAIARALAASPAIVLADEPTANLDHQTGVEIIKLLKTINKQTGVTLVIATHDSKITQEADRIVELLDGQIVKETRCS